MVTSFPVQPARFPYLSIAHFKKYQSDKTKVLHENLLILSKPSNKTSWKDGPAGPVPQPQIFPVLPDFLVFLLAFA